MLWNKFYEKWKNVEEKLGFVKVLVVILCLTILVQTGYILALTKGQRTVIIPSGLIKERISASDNAADEAYVRVMGQYLVNLIYDFTPYTVDARFDEFMAFVPADKLPAIKAELDVKREQVKRLGVSESFAVESFHARGTENFLIRGKLVNYVSGRVIGTDPLAMEVTYQVANGSFQITGMKVMEEQEYETILRKDASVKK